MPLEAERLIAMQGLDRERINDILYRSRKGQTQAEIAEATGIKRGIVACVIAGILANESFGESAKPLEGQERRKGGHPTRALSKYREPRASFRP